MSPLAVLCSTGAAALYASGSLQIKRALTSGVQNRRAIAVTNIAMALWSLPLFLSHPGTSNFRRG